MNKIAINPQSGEIAEFDGAQWKPIDKARIAKDASGNLAVFDGSQWKPLPGSKPKTPTPEEQQADYLRSQPNLSGAPLQSETLLRQDRDSIREVPNSALDQARGALGNYVDAAMLGGADELLAGIESIPALFDSHLVPRPGSQGRSATGPAGETFSGAFSRNLGRLEQQRRDYNAVNSGQGNVATGVGVVANPLNLVGGELIAAAPSVAGRAGRAAATGGAIGGTAGALGTEGDLGDRALGAGIGTIGGAVLGGAAQPGMELLGFGAKKGTEAGRAIYNTLKNQAQAKASPAAQADKLIARALMQDNAYSFPMRPAMPGEGNVNLAGENVVGLGRQATVAPGEGRTIAGNFFDDQAQGAADRGADAIRTMSDRGYYGTVEELDATRRATARPLYDLAYGQPAVEQWTPRVAELFRRPSMRAALTRAQRIAAEEGRDPSELGLTFNEAGDPVFLAGANSRGQIPSVQTMDYVKRGLDDVVEQYRDRTTGRLNLDTEGRAINNTRAEFVGIMRQGNPNYAAALDAWGGPSHALDAVERGRDMYAARGKPADIIRRFQEMAPQDQALARIGFVRNAVEDLGNVGDTGSVYLKLFGNPNKRAVAQVMFPDEASFNRFAAQMDAERRMLGANRTIMGGSPTSRIDADKAAMADAENDLGLIDALSSGSIMRLLGQAVQRGKNFQQGLTPEVAAEVARRLFSQDPRLLAGSQNVRVPAPLAALPGPWLRRSPTAPLLGQGLGLAGQFIATPERAPVR